MYKRLSQRRREEEGFTLIELLIVIVILGILAAIVVFAVGGITDRGKDNACKTEAQTLRTAQEANFAKFGNYTSMSGLQTNGFLTSSTTQYWTVSAPASGTASTYTLAKVDAACPN